MKRVICSDDAPAATGAYGQATTNGSLLFTAGRIPPTLEGAPLADDPIEVRTGRTLDDLAAVLAADGAGPKDVLKVTAFLDDIDDFEAMNETSANYSDGSPPARSAVEGSPLPKGVGVEIEAVADCQ